MGAKDDCEILLQDLLPFARRMLRENGAFHPFGGTMSRTGVVCRVGVDLGDEHPTGAAVRDRMIRSFQAATDELQAAAIVCDVHVTPPGEVRPRDAIQVELDHRDGCSARVFFPYSIHASGDLVTQAPFACRGDAAIGVVE